MRKAIIVTSVITFLFLVFSVSGTAFASQPVSLVSDAALQEPEPECADICNKVGVNTAYPVRRPVDEYLRAQRLGMGWILEIAYHPVDMGRTAEAINRAHDHGLRPIVRVCAGSDCAFSDPAVYSQFLHEIAERVDGEFWALMGPNEPDLEPWAGGAAGVTAYMNTMLDLVSDIPNLRTVSPAFNSTNSVTSGYVASMESYGARFSELDAFAATTYTVAGNGAYSYYSRNLRGYVAKYNKQVIFVEYGTFSMFDKPGEDNPARQAVINYERTQVAAAANDPTVMAILYFDAFGSNGSPHEYYDPEMVALSRDLSCVLASQTEAGIGIYTDSTIWQLTGESACRDIQYGCPYRGDSASVCSGNFCIDNDADGLYGDGGTCTRTDCDDNDPAIAGSCGGGIEAAADWGTLRAMAQAASNDTFIWPNIAIRPNGLPIIAYHDATTGRYDLNILDCTSPDCSTALKRTLVSENNSGQYISMVVREDGRPLIAHFDWTDEDFELFDCADSSCTTGENRILDYVTGYYGFDTSMTIRPDGRPAIAYWHSNESDLRFFNCADGDCLTGTIQTLEEHKQVGIDPSIVIDQYGNPLIAYIIQDYGHLRVHACTDPDCLSGAYRVVDWDNAEGFPSQGMAVRSDGLPVIAYRDTASGALMLVDCHTPTCSSYTGKTLDTGGNFLFGSIAVLPDDSPFIAYTEFTAEGDHNLRLLRCLDPACNDTLIEMVEEGNLGKTPQIAVLPDGNPLVVFHDVGTGGVGLYQVDLTLAVEETPTPTTPVPSDTPETPTPTTPVPSDTPETPTPTTPVPSDTPETPTATTPVPSDTPETPTATTPAPDGQAACFSFTFKQFNKWEQAWFRLANNCAEPVTLTGAKIIWTEWYSGIKLDWIAIADDEVWGAQDGLDPDSPAGPFPQPSITDTMGEDAANWQGPTFTFQPGDVMLMRVDFDGPGDWRGWLNETAGAHPSHFNDSLIYLGDGSQAIMTPVEPGDPQVTPSPTTPAPSETPVTPGANQAGDCFTFTFNKFSKWEQVWFRLSNTCSFPVTMTGLKAVWTEWYPGIGLDWIGIGDGEIWGSQDALLPDLADGPYPQPSTTDTMGADAAGWQGWDIPFDPGEVMMMRYDFDGPGNWKGFLDQTAGAKPSDFNGSLIYFSDGSQGEMVTASP